MVRMLYENIPKCKKKTQMFSVRKAQILTAFRANVSREGFKKFVVTVKKTIS